MTRPPDAAQDGSFASLRNGDRLAEASVPVHGEEAFRRAVLDAPGRGARLVALFARSLELGERIYAVLAHDREGRLAIAALDLGWDTLSYPALTPGVPGVQVFERELREERGIDPRGHPSLKPVRRIEGRSLDRAEGEGSSEVAVGPIHGGIGESGRFRFRCRGDRVVDLDVELGWQHRGVEQILERRRLSGARAALTVETAAGDASVAHALAYAMAVEALAGSPAPPRAEGLRALGLELERLANHAGTLAGIAAEVEHPGQRCFGRIRGALHDIVQEICGSRYGRGLVRPGGCAFDLDAGLERRVREGAAGARTELAKALGAFLGSASVRARLRGTGALARERAEDLGLVGPPARAAGCERDVRHDHPHGPYRAAAPPVALGEGGDVLARAGVLGLECERSLAFLEELRLPEGLARVPVGRLEPDSIAVALAEGARGETAHVVVTGREGEVIRHKVIDPSFRNWTALAVALRGEAISDFPLVTGSLALSCCGHDL